MKKRILKGLALLILVHLCLTPIQTHAAPAQGLLICFPFDGDIVMDNVLPGIPIDVGGNKYVFSAGYLYIDGCNDYRFFDDDGNYVSMVFQGFLFDMTLFTAPTASSSLFYDISAPSIGESATLMYINYDSEVAFADVSITGFSQEGDFYALDVEFGEGISGFAPGMIINSYGQMIAIVGEDMMTYALLEPRSAIGSESPGDEGSDQPSDEQPANPTDEGTDRPSRSEPPQEDPGNDDSNADDDSGNDDDGGNDGSNTDDNSGHGDGSGNDDSNTDDDSGHDDDSRYDGDGVNDDEDDNKGMYFIICAAAIFVIVCVVIIVLTSKNRKPADPNPAVQEIPVSPPQVNTDSNPPFEQRTMPVWEYSPAENPPVSPNEGSKGIELYLFGMSGPLSGLEYRITEKMITIGRAVESNICYPADTKGVSRRHCQIFWRNGVLMIMDLGSTSGTFLRKKGQLQPNTPTIIKEGDVIYLGSKQNALTIQVKGKK